MRSTPAALQQDLIELLKNATHADLAVVCADVGIDNIASKEGEITKRERILAGIRGKSDREIAAIAERVGIQYKNIELEEAALQILEANDPPLTEITRRDIARCFDSTSLSGEIHLLELLRRFWPIDSMGNVSLHGRTLAGDILQHMMRNDDWPVEYLFDHIGALKCSHKRFFRLIEATVHPLARRGSTQEQLCGCLNAVLARDGYRLEVSGYESGYPIYSATRIAGGVTGKPKNLIFASIGPKPEIGFRDAINNDIVILFHAESCLVYDRPIADSGLLWDELVNWWQTDHCTADVDANDARKRLGQRLRQSLASDAERALFDLFFKRFRVSLGPRLPALIPQVYLHYDPAIVARLRTRRGLQRQRMDFLLLFSHGSRVIIEIDGEHHFSKDGKPSLSAYAEMVKADRDLRLLGYEVYRFGANELTAQGADNLVAEFFGRLFEKHAVAK